MKIKNAKASILVVTMIIMGLILTIALSVSLTSLIEKKASIDSNKSNVAYQRADNGVEKTLQTIRDYGSSAYISSVDSDCDGIIENTVEGYRIELKNMDGTIMNATNISGYNCNTVRISSLKILRSIGTFGQDKRSVEVSATLSITATGGTITYTDSNGEHPVADTGTGNPYDGGYTVHTFTSDGTFKVVSGSGKVEYLVVAGGGGGGGGAGFKYGAGGGAGGYARDRVYVSVGDFAIKVGKGGDGGTGSVWTCNEGDCGESSPPKDGSDGGLSSFGIINSVNPGKGGMGAKTQSYDGSNGGKSGNGFDGGVGNSQGYAGSGGGATAVGRNGTITCYDGGAGASDSISGASPVPTYSQGGPGCARSNSPGFTGAANSGNGGGGRYESAVGGKGGSGVVIIRYPS